MKTPATLPHCFSVVRISCSSALLAFLELCFQRDLLKRPFTAQLIQHEWISTPQQDTSFSSQVTVSTSHTQEYPGRFPHASPHSSRAHRDHSRAEELGDTLYHLSVHPSVTSYSILWSVQGAIAPRLVARPRHLRHPPLHHSSKRSTSRGSGRAGRVGACQTTATRHPPVAHGTLHSKLRISVIAFVEVSHFPAHSMWP